MNTYDTMISQAMHWGSRDLNQAGLYAEDTQHWINTQLLPFLEMLRKVSTASEYALADDLARHYRVVRALAEMPPSVTTFDGAIDVVRRTLDSIPQQVARAASQARRRTILEEAKRVEPNERERLLLRAEVDELRAQVAARDEALKLIRNAANV